MSAEADLGFLGQGEVVGIETEGEVPRGWSMQRGWWPLSPQVECTRNWVYYKVKDRQGERLTKVVSVMLEMERLPSQVIADVVRIRPRTNREVLAPVHHKSRQARDVSAPGMAYSSLPNP